jgi:NitT/TauT family transport system ATP-binding protein
VLLHDVGLDGFGTSYPHELSVGMRQRVGIARAFIKDVQLLLMDEPFGALDALTKRTMQEELLRLWRHHRHTLVFVTHDVDEAVALADRIIVFTQRPATVLEQFVLPSDRERGPSARRLPEARATGRRIWQLVLGETNAQVAQA